MTRLPALLATLLLLAACGEAADGTSPSTPTTSETPAVPVDIMTVAEGSLLAAGTYSLPFIAVDDARRVVVDIPSGYYGGGGGFIDSGSETYEPDAYGDLAFWGLVGVVAVDACRTHAVVDAGTTVQELADLLVAQRHRITTEPVPVTLGGYDGLYLTQTAPADISGCRDGVERIYKAVDDGTDDGWLRDKVDNASDHIWILDVEGQRVVASIRMFAEKTQDPQELIDIVESARFVP